MSFSSNNCPNQDIDDQFKNRKEDKHIISKDEMNISTLEIKTNFEKYDVIIIGATSGAHTATSFSAIANIKFVTVMVPFKIKGLTEDDIYTLDYPGNPERDLYPAMFEKTKKQCEKFDCKFYETENLSVRFNEFEQKFFVIGEGIPLISSKWLFYEIMENMVFTDDIFSNEKAIEIKFAKDFTQMCANGCIAFKEYQLKK